MRGGRLLHIPTIGLVDTNCNLELVDYVVPGNYDAIRSNELVIRTIVLLRPRRAEFPAREAARR